MTGLLEEDTIFFSSSRHVMTGTREMGWASSRSLQSCLSNASMRLSIRKYLPRQKRSGSHIENTMGHHQYFGYDVTCGNSFSTSLHCLIGRDI